MPNQNNEQSLEDVLKEAMQANTKEQSNIQYEEKTRELELKIKQLNEIRANLLNSYEQKKSVEELKEIEDYLIRLLMEASLPENSNELKNPIVREIPQGTKQSYFYIAKQKTKNLFKGTNGLYKRVKEAVYYSDAHLMLIYLLRGRDAHKFMKYNQSIRLKVMEYEKIVDSILKEDPNAKIPSIREIFADPDLL